MGPIGAQEMIMIFLVALLLFGPKKLPELGKLLAKGLTEFRRAKSELKTTFEGHLRELEREANVATATANDSSTYPYSTPLTYKPYDESGSAYDYSSGMPIPAAETSTASVTVTEGAEANRESSPAITPVNGTIPRSHSFEPSEPPVENSTQGHPA